MTWDTVQQFVRIMLGWLGAWMLSKGIGNAESIQTLTGGLLMVAQFGWWFIWNRRRPE
jgi:hypothetical protein